MQHPGPPRFVAVGDDVELAPRDPDPAATYEWRIAAAPTDSSATVGNRLVEHLTPDVPGLYRVEIAAPDGTHAQTIRAFPGHLGESAASEGDWGAYDRSASPETTDLPGAPGGEGASGGAGSGRADDESPSTEADSGGRPRVSLSADRTGDAADETDEALVVRAEPQPHPEGGETADDLGVEFLVDDRDDVDASDVTVEGRELRLPTGAVSERVRVYAVSVETATASPTLSRSRPWSETRTARTATFRAAPAVWPRSPDSRSRTRTHRPRVPRTR
jgi:cyclomaltodextrinase